MRQEQILALLKEASSDNCSIERKNKIQHELSGALPSMLEHGSYTEYYEGKIAGAKDILDELYVSTLRNNPELLPTLFPIFAIMCGDRHKRAVFTNVDWSIVQKK